MIMKLWITRDLDGEVFLHNEEPMLSEDHEFFYSDGGSILLDVSDFPEVTFENSPQRVEIKLIRYENKTS